MNVPIIQGLFGNVKRPGATPRRFCNFRFCSVFVGFVEIVFCHLEDHSGQGEQGNQVGNCHETVQGVRNIPHEGTGTNGAQNTDGGKGQLSSVKEVFDEMGVTDIDLISLAKREEEIFTVHSLKPVVLPHSDYVLRLMQRIRDEAHRFAITYFRSLHNKRNIASALDEIPGIGKKYKKLLLEAFGSVENMTRAEKEDFLKIEGFGEKRAQTLYDFFHTDKDETSESEDKE